MFEQIDIPEVPYETTMKCNCGENQWHESAIEVNPLIAGKLILAWEIRIGIECNNCKLYALKDIGVFDDNLQLLDFPNVPELIKRLEELNIKEKIFQVFQNLADDCKSSGISWIK